MSIKEDLIDFTNQYAVCGSEYRMSEFIRLRLEDICEKTEIDKFYNVIGTIASECKTKVLVTAHYDEIGFIVKSIHEQGFLKLSAIGGIDSKILPASEVIVHGKEELFGIIGAKPPHLLQGEDTKKAIKLDNLYVDTGYSLDELKKRVSIGDIVTLKANPRSLEGNRFSSKSIDNRSGLVAMISCIKMLLKLKKIPETYFVATTQEEFDIVGVSSVAYNLEPDIAIVIDTTHGDMVDCQKEKCSSLGKGPVISIGPNMHKEQSKKLINLAKENNISHQISVDSGDSGTEAWATQVSRVGIPTVLISIPLRYMHTSIETVDLEDIKNTAKLIALFIEDIAKEGEQ